MSSREKGPIESITLLKPLGAFLRASEDEVTYEQHFPYSVYCQTCTPAWVVDISEDSRESVRWRDVIEGRATRRWNRVQWGIKEEMDAAPLKLLYGPYGGSFWENTLQRKYEDLIEKCLEGRGVVGAD